MCHVNWTAMSHQTSRYVSYINLATMAFVFCFYYARNKAKNRPIEAQNEAQLSCQKSVLFTMHHNELGLCFVKH